MNQWDSIRISSRVLMSGLAAALVAICGTADAWTPLTVRNSGQFIPVKWISGQVSYRVNPTHLSNVSGSNAEVEAAVDAGFAAWAEASNKSFTITKGPGSSLTSQDGQDGINTVLFTDSATTASRLGGALASTFTFFDLSTGALSDADIVFNTGKQFFGGAFDENAFDLKSVTAHEVGHLLGLDHSTELSATMFQSTPSGSRLASTIGPDDLAALRTTYPGTQPLGAISGRVRKGGAGVPGASVFAVDSRGVVQATEVVRLPDGSFTLRGIPAGTYSVGVQPVAGPVFQSSFNGHYALLPGFDAAFLTRPASGAFVVSAGATASVGDLNVTAGISQFSLGGNVVGITNASSSTFSVSSRVSVSPGATGKELVVRFGNGSGLSSDTQVSISGDGISLGTPSSNFNRARIPLTISSSAASGGHVVTFSDGSDSAVIVGGFEILSAADAGANLPPTANAGADQLLQLGETATLSGSGSDPEGASLTYQWSQTSGPSGALNNEASAVATYHPQGSGVRVFQLSVDDGQAAATDSVTVTFNGAPTSIVPTSLTTEAETTVSLRGSGSDPDGDSLTYRWSQVRGPSTPSLVGVDQSTVSFTPTVAGVYGFTLTVNDGRGGSDTSGEVSVQVDPVNRPPQASAGASRNVTGTAPVTLSASGSSDPEGATLAYLWQQTGGPASVLSDATTRDVSFTPSALGTYRFRLTVSDGAKSESAEVEVTRRSIPPIPVVAGPRALVSGEGASLSAAGSTDPDGESLTFGWTQRSGPAALQLAPRDQAVLQFTPVTAGFYRLALTVRDASGVSSVLDVDVVVRLPQLPPVADAGADRLAVVSSTVELDGSGSRDPQNGPLVYSWQQQSGPGSVSLTGATSNRVRFVPSLTGEYDLRLTVSATSGLVSSDIVRITAVSSSPTETVAIALQSGLNLISLPVEPVTSGGATFRASDLASRIGSRFVVSTSPGSPPERRFRVFDAGDRTSGFEIQGGQGYLVSSPTSQVITFTGQSWPASSASVPLSTGPNLVGIPRTSGTTSSAAELAGSQGATLVSEIGVGARTFTSTGTTADFPLEPRRGYVIVVPGPGLIELR